MEKTKAVKCSSNYARSIPHSKGEAIGLEITEMRISGNIIKGPVAKLISKDEEMRSESGRKYVNLANESRAVFSVRTAAPPIADLVCEIMTTHPERAKNINERSPYFYLELTWDEFLYYAIDNEPRMQKYLLQLVSDLVDGGRAWVIDYGTGKGDIAKPFFISDIQYDEIEKEAERKSRENLKQYKEEREETPHPRRIERLTLFAYRRLFQSCWEENRGVRNRGAGYLFTDHAFTTNFLRAYAELLSGRTEESQQFLCMYNPQRKRLVNEKYKQVFDSRLFAMAVWFMIHAEANADKPFAQRVKKNSAETVAMLQQVAPNTVRSAGKGKEKAYYIRDKLDAQIFIDTACWILNYGARQGFFEHFKAIPTKCLYERGKRESDFCFEIRFAANTPRGEEKTMRNVQPYTSNLQERLLERNIPAPPLEGHTTLWL